MPIDKVEYTPTQEKRFKVSPDIHSSTRLQFVRDLQKSMVETTPFDIGVALIGSLAKGKVLDKETEGATDVDAIVYLDSESVVRHFDDEKTPVTIRDGYNLVIGKWDKLSYMPKDNLSKLDTSHIKEDDSLKVKGTVSYLRDYIMKFTDDGVKKYDHDMLTFSQDIYVLPIAKEGEYSILDMVDKYEKALSEDDEYGINHNQTSVAYVFGLDIGGGLKKYRQAFIQQLQEKEPEEAERIWSIVNASVRKWERRNNIPENLEDQFPATFKKAAAYYMPHTS